MDKTALEHLPLDERIFSAMAELAHQVEVDGEELTIDLIMKITDRWSTDDPTKGIVTGKDAMLLSSAIVHHTMSHQEFEQNVVIMSHVNDAITEAGIDPQKLVDNDPEEIERFHTAIAIGPDDLKTMNMDELTVDDLLKDLGEPVSDDVNHRGSDAHLLLGFNRDIAIAKIAIDYLANYIDGDSVEAHQIIENSGCLLVHGLTDILFKWVSGGNVLDEDDDMEDWLDALEDRIANLDRMTDEEKVAYAKILLEEED